MHADNNNIHTVEAFIHISSYHVSLSAVTTSTVHNEVFVVETSSLTQSEGKIFNQYYTCMGYTELHLQL